MNLRFKDIVLWGLAIGGEAGRAYHAGKLFLWTPANYSRRKYKSLVTRLERDKLVQQVTIEGSIHYRLTAGGKKQLDSLYPLLPLKQDSWDGFWRIVIFDIPERQRRVRDKLRRQLVKLGFGQLQHGAYLSAYDYPGAFLQWLKLNDLTGKVLLLESKQKYLAEPKKLAAQVWHLESVAKGYQEVIDRLTTRFGIKDPLKREEFLKRVYRQYLSVLLKDPLLPKELLPDNWPADKARKFVLRAGVIKE